MNQRSVISLFALLLLLGVVESSAATIFGGADRTLQEKTTKNKKNTKSTTFDNKKKTKSPSDNNKKFQKDKLLKIMKADDDVPFMTKKSKAPSSPADSIFPPKLFFKKAKMPKESKESFASRQPKQAKLSKTPRRAKRTKMPATTATNAPSATRRR